MTQMAWAMAMRMKSKVNGKPAIAEAPAKRTKLRLMKNGSSLGLRPPLMAMARGGKKIERMMRRMVVMDGSWDFGRVGVFGNPA